MRANQIPAGLLPKKLMLFYGGAWHEPLSGQYADTINPAYNEVLARVPVAGARDVDAAVKAAHAAFPAWSATPPLKRSEYLRRIAEVLRAHKDELAMLDALNNGNPVSALAQDAAIAAAVIDYVAGLVTELKGQTIPMGDRNLNYTLREPVGVVDASSLTIIP